jgi:hypothetical protein
MSIAVEYFTLTGPISNPDDGLIPLSGFPTTGPQGSFDVAVNPMTGRSMVLEVDFGLTGVNYNTLTYNLENSAIKSVRQRDIDLFGVGSTGIELRVAYNRE